MPVPGRPIWRRIVFENRRDQTGLARALERAAARHHFVDNCAKCKNIGPIVDPSTFELLWRHVLDRADRGSILRQTVGLGCRCLYRLEGGSTASNLASPKSSNFAPDGVSITFAGFKSRWIMP